MGVQLRRIEKRLGRTYEQFEPLDVHKSMASIHGILSCFILWICRIDSRYCFELMFWQEHYDGLVNRQFEN
jgi:hypothetical protein